MSSPLIDELVSALRCLPGVGPRSAKRMAHYLLHRDRNGAQRLAQALQAAATLVRYCEQCNSFAEQDLCERCANPRWDRSQLCIVESPADVFMLEQTHAYRGLYYVLMGAVSPIEGIGPEELKLHRLLQRVGDGQVKEVIIATNFTNEGEATAHVLAAALSRHGLKVMRMAHGLPFGAELEYSDIGSIAQALHDRREMPAEEM